MERGGEQVATIGQLTRDAVAIERSLLRCGFLQRASDAYMGIPAEDDKWTQVVSVS